MKTEVFIIRDNGVEENSMPFYAPNVHAAKRQFVAQLRVLPPSARREYSLMSIGHYDTDTCYHSNTGADTVCSGFDEHIFNAVIEDEEFYRPRVDNLSVKESSK